MSDQHTVTFTLTKNEYKKATKGRNKSKAEKTLRWFIPFYLVCAFLVFLIEGPSDRVRIGLLTLVVVLLVIIVWVVKVRRRKKDILDNLQPTEVVIAPEGLSIKSNGTEARIEWRHVGRITQDEDFIRLYILGKNVSLMIPKRAFSDSSDAEGFFKDAKHFCKEA